MRSFIIVLSILSMPLFAGASGAPDMAGKAGERTPLVPDASWINAAAAPFGAKGDGVTDDTAAIQAALDLAAKHGGGVVYLPAGNYLVKTHLSVPAETALVGVGRAPEIYTSKAPGSTLLAVEGAGTAEGTAFITLQGPDSTLQGLKVFYPNQEVNPKAIPYPWTVRGGPGDGAALIDVLLVNPYQAVDLATMGGGRHYIRGLYGQPLFKGVWVDKCYDIGRIHDVHFWPFWSQDKKVMDYTEANATSFIFQRTDWEVVENVFSWGYHVGVEFSASKDGAMNGQMTDIAFDGVDIGIDARAMQKQGVVISNLSIANDGRGTVRTAIVARSPAEGAVQVHVRADGTQVTEPSPVVLLIRGGSFWGAFDRVVSWNNAGYFSLSDSRVIPFTAEKSIIDLNDGKADIHDNSILIYDGVVKDAKPGIGIRVGPACAAVNIHDNQLNGNRIANEAGDHLITAGNQP